MHLIIVVIQPFVFKCSSQTLFRFVVTIRKLNEGNLLMQIDNDRKMEFHLQSIN